MVNGGVLLNTQRLFSGALSGYAAVTRRVTQRVTQRLCGGYAAVYPAGDSAVHSAVIQRCKKSKLMEYGSVSTDIEDRSTWSWVKYGLFRHHLELNGDGFILSWEMRESRVSWHDVRGITYNENVTILCGTGKVYTFPLLGGMRDAIQSYSKTSDF